MSKIQAPEPVAVVCHGYDLFFMGGGPIADLVKRLDVKVGDWLITATQAEAYKDACVREALEEAETAITALLSKQASVRAADAIAAIRALLPSTPARPESEQ